MSQESGWMGSDRYAAQASPVYRALWQDAPLVLAPTAENSRPLQSLPLTIDRAVKDRLKKACETKTLWGDNGKYSEAFLQSLGEVGYWGLLAPHEQGGLQGSMVSYLALLADVACHSSSLAGLASVHNGIGATGLLTHFGSAAQQSQLLPALAKGERLSAFALTEPAAGSDVTSLRSQAVRVGSHYEITGEKRFITNAFYGRRIALIANCDGEPAAFVVDLPTQDTAQFSLRQYELHPLKRSHNYGLIMRGLQVPLENRIEVPGGNGLTAAYFGLNRGRATIAAVASGSLTKMLVDLLPWVRKRITYGKLLAEHELILSRIARLASLIVGCRMLAQWCGRLLDAGYRGELEGIVAKVFAASALEEGAIQLAMRTHGGRTLVKGHPIGDSLMDYLAPSIYEGENQLLGLGMMRTLCRPPQSQEAVTMSAKDSCFGRASQEAFAQVRQELQQQYKALSGQQMLAQWSARVQMATVLQVVGSEWERLTDPVEQSAGELLAKSLTRELQMQRATAADFEEQAALGSRIVAGEWSRIGSFEAEPIMLDYL